MKFIDRFINQKFAFFNRNTILSLLYSKQKLLSTKWLKQKYLGLLLHYLSSDALFTLIHDKNLWGSDESVSGPGSTFNITRNIRAALPDLFETYDIKSVLDIPCGDFNWMKHIDLKNVEYTGADIVEAIVNENDKRYGNQQRKFVLLDIVKDKLPKSDLILCRDCLVHLTDYEVKKVLQNIKDSEAEFLLATTFPGQKGNVRIGRDHWRPINLQIKPFCLPPPILLIRENEQDERYADKSLGFWQINDI